MKEQNRPVGPRFNLEQAPCELRDGKEGKDKKETVLSERNPTCRAEYKNRKFGEGAKTTTFCTHEEVKDKREDLEREGEER